MKNNRILTNRIIERPNEVLSAIYQLRNNVDLSAALGIEDSIDFLTARIEYAHDNAASDLAELYLFRAREYLDLSKIVEPASSDISNSLFKYFANDLQEAKKYGAPKESIEAALSDCMESVSQNNKEFEDLFSPKKIRKKKKKEPIVHPDILELCPEWPERYDKKGNLDNTHFGEMEFTIYIDKTPPEVITSKNARIYTDTQINLDNVGDGEIRFPHYEN